VIDLYGVNVKLWLKKSGKLIPFRNIAGAATDYIESINVRIGLLEIFHVEIKLSPPLRETEILLNSGAIGLGFSTEETNSSDKKSQPVGDSTDKKDKTFHMNKIVIQFDYGGLESRAFEALLTIPEISISESGIDITMKGFGMLFEQTKKSALLNVNNNYQAIQQLLSPNNSVILKIDPKAKEVLEASEYKPGSSKNAIEESKEILLQHGCLFYNRGSKNERSKQVIEIVHTDTFRNEGEKSVAATFVAFRDINPNKKIYPILGLSSPVSNIVASNVLMGAIGGVVDKSKKEISEKRVDGKTLSEDTSSKIPTQDGSIAGPSDSAARDENGESFGVDDSGIQGQLMGASTVESLKAIVHDYMTKVFNYEITSVLIPDLLPARMVGVAVGNIKALSNKYDLKTVEHSITQNGAETIIHCTGMGGLASASAQRISKIKNDLKEKAESISENSQSKTPKPVDNP